MAPRVVAAGCRPRERSDFPGLSEEERELVELRAAVSAAVRDGRTKRNLTQAKLAELLQSSQSRVAKIEAGSSDVSLDLMFRSLFAVGGRVADVLRMHSTRRSPGGGRPPAKRKKTLTSAAH